MSEEFEKTIHPDSVYIRRTSEELTSIRKMLTEVIHYMREAESEVTEKMRRFTMYMDDLHHIAWMYTEVGQEPPQHIKREMERCDDRFRQLLTEAHSEGEVFEKVRRKMADDPLNRWDHTRQLEKSKELKA